MKMCPILTSDSSASGIRPCAGRRCMMWRERQAHSIMMGVESLYKGDPIGEPLGYCGMAGYNDLPVSPPKEKPHAP